MKVICIDNSIQSSPSRQIEKYLFIPQLVIGNEYTVYDISKRTGGYLLEEIDNMGDTGFAKNRFVICDNTPVEEVADELCN